MTFTHDLLERVSLAKKLISKDIRYHLTISDLSRQTGLNEFQLKRGFKELYGVGLYEYLLKERMEKAAFLLTQTDKPIKEIAMLCGYRHMKNLQPPFKRTFKQTPGAYRREQTNNSSLDLLTES